MKLFTALIIFTIKYLTILFYKVKVVWVTPQDQIRWQELRLVICLNHTSLFEFLFAAAVPNSSLWRAIDRLVLPIADTTLGRPLTGMFFKLLIPNAMPITRKRDDSWSQLMERVAGNSLILIFPEGRMMRKDGLDKHGKPMSIKGGVADILAKIPHGKLLIAYSHGLHHVQAPGDLLPKPFKKIQVGFEQIDIKDYVDSLDKADFRTAVIKDLEDRKNKHCRES